MAADKHYHQPAPNLPEALEDHQPDDMPAARSLFLILIALFGIAIVVAVIVYQSYQTRLKNDVNSDPQNTEQAP